MKKVISLLLAASLLLCLFSCGGNLADQFSKKIWAGNFDMTKDEIIQLEKKKYGGTIAKEYNLHGDNLVYFDHNDGATTEYFIDENGYLYGVSKEYIETRNRDDYSILNSIKKVLGEPENSAEYPSGGYAAEWYFTLDNVYNYQLYLARQINNKTDSFYWTWTLNRLGLIS